MEFLFEYSTQYLTNKRSKQVRYQVEDVSHIKTLLTRRSRLNSGFKERACCHSFMALKRASDKSAADWPSQTHVKKYCNFSQVVIWFFSVVEIPIKHSSLYNKALYKTVI